MDLTRGAHESYAIPESFHKELITDMTLSHRIFKFFSASRQTFAGAGHLGYLGRDKVSHLMFWVSPRIYFIDLELNTGTVRNTGRALVNSRIKPLVAGNLEGMQRLHCIVGDMNRSPWSIYLKIGVTVLVLEFLQLVSYEALNRLGGKMKSDGTLIHRAKAATLFLNDNALKDDFDFLLDIQYRLSDAVWGMREEISERHNEFEEIFSLWREALDAAASEGVARKKFEKRLDWLIKRKFIRELVGGEIPALDKIERGDKLRKLLSFDFAYHRVNHKDLYKFLVKSGAIEEKYAESEAAHYLSSPPGGRAKSRVLIARRAQELGIVRNITDFDWARIGFIRDLLPQADYDRRVPPRREIAFDDRSPETLKLHLEDIYNWIRG